MSNAFSLFPIVLILTAAISILAKAARMKALRSVELSLIGNEHGSNTADAVQKYMDDLGASRRQMSRSSIAIILTSFCISLIFFLAMGGLRVLASVWSLIS